ncbi:hypothetical protein M8818_003086 [Zalaria obscura]|uniref:Uncharacterized protein n=1 Tax=Zalaria obscura TaxID=2024903 RepID=A0ACC3SGI1_9PEZI
MRVFPVSGELPPTETTEAAGLSCSLSFSLTKETALGQPQIHSDCPGANTAIQRQNGNEASTKLCGAKLDQDHTACLRTNVRPYVKFHGNSPACR